MSRGEHARAYHAATKHSWESVRRDDHVLDWDVRPSPFKVYPGAPASPLPRDLALPDAPAIEAVRQVVATGDRGTASLDALAALLFLSAGLTKKRRYPGGEEVHFRAAASTGALYETEVYLVTGPLPGLGPGVYHYDPRDSLLRRLRAGDHREALATATSDPDRVRAAPATLVLSGIYWRNTWKYRARAYRHLFWNAGTMLANSLAVAAAQGWPAAVLLGFADGPVNDLLGLDPTREGSLALVPVGTGAPGPPAAGPLPALEVAALPLSAREGEEPLVRDAYAASSLPDGDAARAWARLLPAPSGADPGRDVARADRSETVHPLVVRPAPTTPLGEVILRRGSTRRFARQAIGFPDLSTILEASVRALPLDVAGPARPLVDCYVLVHAVDGLASGAYVLDRDPARLRCLRTGEFRAEGGYLCLEQPLGADASAVVFFLADLGRVLASVGDRGYRAVNLAAGLLGGRMYLAAYALGLGASGLTFYDDDVVEFFSPDARGKDAIFVTALGRPRRSSRPGLGLAEGDLIRLRPGER